MSHHHSPAGRAAGATQPADRPDLSGNHGVHRASRTAGERLATAAESAAADGAPLTAAVAS
jgi:hypothetical protein